MRKKVKAGLLRGFNLFNDTSEYRGIMFGNVCKDLAVKPYAVFCQRRDETAIRCSVLAAGGIDLDLPERTE